MGANYQAKMKSLDFGISLSSNALENTVLGVLCSCENMGWIFQKYDNNRQKNLIFMILPCAALVHSKNTLT